MFILNKSLFWKIVFKISNFHTLTIIKKKFLFQNKIGSTIIIKYISPTYYLTELSVNFSY